jgi:hypothetical protein
VGAILTMRPRRTILPSRNPRFRKICTRRSSSRCSTTNDKPRTPNLDSTSASLPCKESLLKLPDFQRDRSLNPELFQVIANLPKLRILELSGHSHRYYNASLLGGMQALEDLRIMMPDSELRDSLVKVVKSLGERKQGGLRGLALICLVGRPPSGGFT